MKKLTITVVAMICIASGSTRVYEVEPFKNYNGWVDGSPRYGIAQTFIATCDSFLWAEIFIGAENRPGQYIFTIAEHPGGTPIADGVTDAGPGIHYDYIRAYLRHRPNAKVIKGKQYILKITHSTGDSYQLLL